MNPVKDIRQLKQFYHGKQFSFKQAIYQAKPVIVGPG